MCVDGYAADILEVSGSLTSGDWHAQASARSFERRTGCFNLRRTATLAGFAASRLCFRRGSVRSFASPVDTVTDTRESCGTLEDIEELAELIGSLLDPSSLMPSSQPPQERVWLIALKETSKDGWVPLEAFLYLPEVDDFFENRGIGGQSCFACLVAAACRSSRLRLDMQSDEPRVRLDGKRKEQSQAQVERRELNSFEPYQLVGGRVLAVDSTGKSQDCLLVDIGASIPCSIHVHNTDDFSPGVWLQEPGTRDQAYLKD
eukprot:s2457_g3.t1